jgi:hypothetical protein
MKGFSDSVDPDFRHKKTTHRIDRRLVESVGVSTPYIVILPNSAGFGIWDGVDGCKWIGLIVFEQAYLSTH